MAGGAKMKPNSLYPDYEMYLTEETVEQNHQEIERAIDEVKGNDIEIQKIWDRFIK
jgi:hypothetical protein